ncbi:enoyl-CoA hydratase/isomerase family protein [Mycolicibacter icosiumassiliensis]|uniref:enoyl-CoA hydratase/isomerase family protein n=1 Tax=Mycolicibacter icosiumassiliensis TaxID=1792835 RepID=UPI0008350775|nr:enoyl-CoA hydratase/isomerase family protein [Mycolicibacter icosiumassiliensis]
MSSLDRGASIRLDCAGRIATVTIDHSARRNALTVSMLVQLDEILTRLRSEHEVQVVVLTGAGDDFSAGLDIRDLREGRNRGIELEHRMTAVEERLAAFPKPTVAAIGGYCIGGGMQLAAACDLRLASDTAQFGITPAKLGIVYPSQTVTRLVRILGPAAAKRLIFTAELIDAKTAVRLNLVSEVTTGAMLAHRAAGLANLIATRSPISVVAAKEMIDAACSGGIDEVLERKWSLDVNPDAAEGLDAFLDRRSPDFSGCSRVQTD